METINRDYHKALIQLGIAVELLSCMWGCHPYFFKSKICRLSNGEYVPINKRCPYAKACWREHIEKTSIDRIDNELNIEKERVDIFSKFGSPRRG